MATWLYYSNSGKLHQHGVTYWSAAELWMAYRIGAHFGVFCAIAASIIAKRTERSDQLFMTTPERPAKLLVKLRHSK